MPGHVIVYMVLMGIGLFTVISGLAILSIKLEEYFLKESRQLLLKLLIRGYEEYSKRKSKKKK